MTGGEAKFLLFMITLFGGAMFLGLTIGMRTANGGWGRRLTHSCGWFKHCADWPRDMQAGKPCPRCGRADDDWVYRVGRPIMFGVWDWQRPDQK